MKENYKGRKVLKAKGEDIVSGIYDNPDTN